jgi:hypothetical protein
VDQRDHGARRLADDPVDQAQRVVGALAEPDECNVGMLLRRHRADVLDADLARDHLVAEPDDDRSYQGEPVLALVGDQHPQMVGLPVAHATLHPRV